MIEQKNKRWQMLCALLGACVLALLSSCSSVTATIHYFKSTDHFVPLESDPRVLYEPGAEVFAEQVAVLLPNAIEQVEAGHYRPFADRDSVEIYVCTSEKSFHDLTGRDVKAIIMRKVFLSPRLMKEPKYLPNYLAHELSHLHLKQEIGTYKYLHLPFWFDEGLATLVSNSGGAGSVSRADAVEAIRAGNHFEPHGDGSILFRKTPSHWGLKPHMLYRQAMMFMAFMKTMDEEKYRSFLLNIQNGKDLNESFEKSFNMPLAEMWKRFTEEIKIVRRSKG